MTLDMALVEMGIFALVAVQENYDEANIHLCLYNHINNFKNCKMKEKSSSHDLFVALCRRPWKKTWGV